MSQVKHTIELLDRFVADHHQDHWDEPSERFSYAEGVMDLKLDLIDHSVMEGNARIEAIAQEITWEDAFDNMEVILELLQFTLEAQ